MSSVLLGEHMTENILMNGNNEKRKLDLGSDSEDELLFSLKKKKRLVVSDGDSDEDGDAIQSGTREVIDIPVENHQSSNGILGEKVAQLTSDEDDDDVPLSLLNGNRSEDTKEKHEKKRLVILDCDSDEDDNAVQGGNRKVTDIPVENHQSSNDILEEKVAPLTREEDDVPFSLLKGNRNEDTKEKHENPEEDPDHNDSIEMEEIMKQTKIRKKPRKKKNIDDILEQCEGAEPSATKKPRQKKDGGSDKPSKWRRAKTVKSRIESEETTESVPINLDRDLFDTDDLEEGELNGTEVWLEPEYVTDAPDRSEKKPKGRVKNKKPKEKVKKPKAVPKKEREQELFDIQRENQRLRREMAIKLPCRKNPIRNLDEFLKFRENKGNVSAVGTQGMVQPIASSKPVNGYGSQGEIDEEENQSKVKELGNVDCREKNEMDIAKDVMEYIKDSVAKECCSSSDDVIMDIMECIKDAVEKESHSLNEPVNLNLGINVPNEVHVHDSGKMIRNSAVAKTDNDELKDEIVVNATKPFETEANGVLQEKSLVAAADELICSAEPKASGSKTDEFAHLPVVNLQVPSKEKFIYFDVEDSDSESSENEQQRKKSSHKQKEFQHFIEKFVAHTKDVPKKQEHQEVKMSIVTKDALKNELKLSEIYVDVSHKEEEEKPDKPGAKLAKLKAQLLDKIWKKKEETIEKWKEQDAEEAFLDDEEEAELTDVEVTDDEDMDAGEHNEKSEEEDDGDDEEEGDGDDEEDEDEYFTSTKRKKPGCAFIDDEASESNDNSLMIDTNSLGRVSNQSKESSKTSFSGIFLKNESDGKENVPVLKTNAEPTEEDSRLLYFESDSESSAEKKEDSLSIKSNKSFEISASAIPPYQPGGGFAYLKNSQARSNSHSEREDSVRTQFSDKVDDFSQPETSQQVWPSQNPNQTPTWQDDFVQLKSPTRISSLLGDKTPQANTDDLLFLCSGKFTESQTAPCETSVDVPCGANDDHSATDSGVSSLYTCTKSDYSQFPDKSDDAVSSASVAFKGGNDELDYFAKPHPDPAKLAKDLQFSTSTSDIDVLELCSGTFGTSSVQATEEPANTVVEQDEKSPVSLPSVRKKHRIRIESDSEEDETSVVPVSALHVEDKFTVPSPFSCDSDGMDEVDEVMQEELECLGYEEKVTNAADYFEKEAELSGSDVGSDADEDEDGDGNLEDLIHDGEGYSDEYLRNQIGKVHMKKLMDEDKRQLRLYQELYLEDGDLHTDGPGRQRKFTWRNSSQQQLVHGEEHESESDTEENPEEEQWRRERHEREKWLREQEQQKSDQPESSPAKPKLRRSMKFEIVNKSLEQNSFTVVESPTSDTVVPSLPEMKACRGSFLARGEGYLSSLAKKMKNVEDDSTGSRTTKHFVFRAVSPEKDKPQMRKSNSQPIVTRSAKPTVAQKRKSVFDYFG